MFRLMIVPVSLVSLLIASGCGSGPHEIAIEPWEVLLVDLVNAWENQDIELMESLFRDDFEHHLLEVYWDDYNGDGIIDEYWGLEYELAFAEGTFNEADSISFQYTGSGAVPWTGDSTGQSIAMSRTVNKIVYTPQDSTQTITDVVFVCRPDGQGDWYIWMWWDIAEYPPAPQAPPLQ